VVISIFMVDNMYFTMMITRSVLIICVIQFTTSTHILDDIEDDNIYDKHNAHRTKTFHNQFAVLVPRGTEMADRLASKHGFKNLGQIGDLDNYFLFEHSRIQKRSTTASDLHAYLLTHEPDVKWWEQQVEKKRVKRDGLGPDEIESSSFPNWESFVEDHFGNLGKAKVRTQRQSRRIFVSDPMFKAQWHLNGGGNGGNDMNVQPAWNRGYSGKGVVVTILDDGVQRNHPELIGNYDPKASTDINGNDNDPMPQDNGDNKHGTRCAGEVAAAMGNGVCGVGIAFNASIGGVRMLDGIVNDAVEARALSLNPNHIDVYSASWGPEDDGKTVDGPGPLAKRAFLNGVVRGRHGKGSIFVWASGNGGRYSDNCNCDGYTNSIFTLSISSATQNGFRPWYLEECSSTLATTYSSGTPGNDASIATVDQDARLRNDHICTTEHTGTSASAPIAAGVCALALEANPGLTWRDMQYLVVMTSRAGPLRGESGWSRNGAGREFSHQFGYGLMDAGRIVEMAAKWRSLPTQHICQSIIMVPNEVIPDVIGQSAITSVRSDGCTGTLNAVRYLEHVQCRVSLRYYPRGSVMIILTSPSGTRSTLLFPRPRDSLASNFDEWPFLSIHFWGESPVGIWTLEVKNMGRDLPSRRGRGLLRKWQLIFYGTEDNPVRLPRNIEFRTGRETGGFNAPSFFQPPASFTDFFKPFQIRVKRWMFGSEGDENREEENNYKKAVSVSH